MTDPLEHDGTNRPYENDLTLALQLADIADQVTVPRFSAPDLQVETKPDMTLVSDADKASECAIREAIRAARPSDEILGEEEGREGADSDPTRTVSERLWVIDPIDGTHNFVRGVPVWATLIALMVDGAPVVGVVSAPALGRRWWADLNGGAFMTAAHEGTPGGAPNARAIRTSDVRSLDSAFLSISSVGGFQSAGLGREIQDLMDACWRTRGFGDFWSYMMVAEGTVNLATEPDLALYDMAALVPIVTQAGGVFTNLSGQPGPVGPGALATNAHLSADALMLLGIPSGEDSLQDRQ